MSKRRPAGWGSYGVAALAVAAALVGSLLLGGEIVVYNPFLLFFGAVMFAAWYGGLWPGLLATLLSAVLSNYFIMEPLYSLSLPTAESQIRLLLFVLVASIISWLSDRRRRAEADAVRQREYFRVALSSIGDAVIVTDASGRVTFINDVAQDLTGWRHDEAIGEPLEKVFPIIDEQTREKIENPVAQVLRDGRIIGLSSHTILLGRDGRETPIDDSGAPIRDRDGRIIGVVLVFRDISERRRADQARRLSEEQLRELNAGLERSVEELQTLLEVIPIGIGIAEAPDANRIRVNSAFSRMLGLPPSANASMSAPEGERPKNFRLFSGGRELSPDELPLQRAARYGEIVSEMEVEVVRDDGVTLQLLEYAAPLLDETGKPRGSVGAFVDITERKRAEKEREELLRREKEARLEAEAANRAKDEFLATVSHELRTPLNAILGWAHLLRTGRLDETAAGRAMETIERNARTQAQIIEDILDVSRIITGNLRLDIRPVEMIAVIGTAIDAVTPGADAKRIAIRANLDPVASAITGDPNRLQQVVWNLLANAVKFTPPGGRIDVTLRRNGSYSELEVRDNGQGISADFLPQVFERFKQADSSSTRAHKGLGLGLAIVRHLVEMHGGTVEAFSEGDGKGATFTVRLLVGG